ncbi:MAG: M28 family peptidase [Bacteroidetes bacterium]|nr:M28 family peptidase [Bacteroidota bacterium]
MKRIVWILPFLLLSVSLHAQKAVKLPAVPSPSSPDITAKELKTHITWLASDALEGRGTGTPSIDLAADYIAREFKRYGLKPAGDNGSYFQTFEVITGVELTKHTLSLRLDGGEVPVEEGQFMPYTFSASGEFQGRPVFVGYGITAPSGERDDYGRQDVTGRVVLVRAGYPEDADPHGSLPMLASARAKALTAREHGAAALLIIHDDDREVHEFRYDRSPSDAGIPVGKIHIEAARRILDAAGIGSQVLEPGTIIMPQDDVQLEVAGNFAVSLVRKNTRNVLASLDGTEYSDYFVVGAHYDHLGWGQEGSLYRGEEPMIHNGADDNASGTAGMLELAQWYAAHPQRHAMLFMAFSGEEMGLLGSGHWVDNPTVPLAKIRAMYNLDMIGRLIDSTRQLNVQGIATSPIWKAIVEKENDTEKFNLALIDDGQGSSDHSSFYTKGIPVLFFFTGLHTDYHRPSDDADKIDYAGEEKVTRYVAEIISDADAADEIPFTKVVKNEEQQVARFNVYVGTIPDYSANEHGFRINGTSPGSPADKAGLKEGDIITRFGDTEVRNIYDYMTALSRHKPGEEVPVVVLRGEDHVTLNVALVSK